ncbi:IS1 family transposase [Tenacibaculum finnmarkense]|uniref:IS1 family transposase n=2 Tax=Tenacibaculum finnmarkense TaxID=2781243 RepID=A0AAP1WH64_9FLAO|nr:IS1 family transposase [Tenacibaculum finnmarkense]MBE7649209.1 IS1 family transposase [Tenacibaculum finnmarkense genomovar ulcerans]MBE7653807.1 IS1 family transposase [Tenacibaculum finnmarkense genomovar finnmarkense]MBE7696111.1 IS1 family transposase [Tenacibaculum finnmarkense genomovar finnmarkense]MCD8428346.1 IS1 family transposase [Tenacibaculum finnmarkense genomovar finnmarkense]MCD8440806.1 IS1 family transposase [Tenacibaculum finnmarkense genomovar ulcerans]
MDCPKCKSEKKIKNGVIKGIQRYKCKSCGYNYTVERRSCDYPLSTKNKALQLYLEGLGFRSVGRLLGVSNVSVLNWIRAFGNEISSLQPESQDIEMVEVDEMHSYIGHKKYCWIWIAVDRYGKRFLHFVTGDRSTKTAKKFWEGIKDNQMKTIASDYWKPYRAIIIKDKHVQSKAETFTVEGYNSLFRHFLARMRRKSKCYSKSIKMLELSMLLLMHY